MSPRAGKVGRPEVKELHRAGRPRASAPGGWL